MRYVCPNMVIMPLYGHVYLISICKLSIICINSESRHVIVTEFRLIHPPTPKSEHSWPRKFVHLRIIIGFMGVRIFPGPNIQTSLKPTYLLICISVRNIGWSPVKKTCVSLCVCVGLLRAHYTPLQQYMGYLCTRKAQYAPPRCNMHHGAQGRLCFLKNSGDPDNFLFWWFTEKRCPHTIVRWTRRDALHIHAHVCKARKTCIEPP